LSIVVTGDFSHNGENFLLPKREFLAVLHITKMTTTEKMTN